MSNSTVYSFDVFDTILVRKWAKPTDLFIELGSILQQNKSIDISIDEWKKLRESSEKEAKAKTCSGEVTLAQIYELLAPTFGWSSQKIEHSMNLEIELELASLYPIEQTRQEIQNLHRDGQGVVYLSDMYLPSKAIKQFLKYHQIWQPKDKIYVSSEYSANKASGKLFQIFLNHEDIKPAQLIHLGDNYHSDVKIPRKLGIKAQHFDKTQLNDYEQILVNSEDLPLQFRSLLAGTMRLCRLQNPENNLHNQVIWDTSASVIAPLLFGYVYWCLSEAKAKGIKRLYFVARDGQILLKIAKVICDKWNYAIDCRYLYGSRQAWHFPAITEISETELDWIFDPTQFLSVQSVCDRVNLKPEQIEDILIINDFSTECWNTNLDVRQRLLLKQVFQKPEISQLIVNIAAIYREKAIGYFHQEELGDGVPFGIVDIGWHGRLQCSLSKLLQLADMYPSEGISGFYFGLCKKIKKFSQERLFAYFSDFDRPSKRDSLCHKALLELFVTADHGGTVRFELENGVFVSILRSKENNKALEWGLAVQHSAVEVYANQFVDCLKTDLLDSNTLLKASEKLLRQFIQYPSKLESEVFGSFLFAEDQTENTMYELAPKYQLADALNLVWDRQHPHHNVWYAASLRRTNSLIKLVVHPRIRKMVWKIRLFFKPIKKILLVVNSNKQSEVVNS